MSFKPNSSRFTRGNNNSGRPAGAGGKRRSTTIGSVNKPKSLTAEKLQLVEDAAKALRDEKVTLNVQIYPPKGVEEITLRRGDVLWLNFFKYDKDKDFTEGHLSMPINDEQ